MSFRPLVIPAAGRAAPEGLNAEVIVVCQLEVPLPERAVG
jgi:hypothetical protein